MVRGQRRLKTPIDASTLTKSKLPISNCKKVTMLMKPLTITNFFVSETNIENAFVEKEVNHTPTQPCVRISPRKHASTLSVLQQTNHNNNITPKKSPHKIEINYDLAYDDIPEKTIDKPVTLTPQPPKKLPRGGKKDKGESKPNHKLTDYFPVRRSIRKTKKAVEEEAQKELEAAVISGKEDGLRVSVFEGKGRGVVAARRFEKGDFVVEYAGDLISTEEARRRESLYADIAAGCYMYYFTYRGAAYCVDATRESPKLGRLVNHSRNGNLTTKVVPIGNLPRLVLIAKDTILEGDELTYDYGDRSKESLRHHPWLAL